MKTVLCLVLLSVAGTAPLPCMGRLSSGGAVRDGAVVDAPARRDAGTHPEGQGGVL